MSTEPRICLTHVSVSLISSMLHTSLSMKGLIDVVTNGSDALESAAAAGEESSNVRIASAIAHNSRNAALAAALVFQHASCENALIELCEALAVRDPRPWLAKIRDRKISFSQAFEKPSGEVALNLITQFIRDLEKRSLPEKVEVVLSILQPPSTCDVIPGFSFSMDELRRIDQARHSLVHRPNFTVCGTRTDDIQYLSFVVQMLLAIAEDKYRAAPTDA
jgi:hypothetical protein